MSEISIGLAIVSCAVFIVCLIAAYKLRDRHSEQKLTLSYLGTSLVFAIVVVGLYWVEWDSLADFLLLIFILCSSIFVWQIV